MIWRRATHVVARFSESVDDETFGTGMGLDFGVWGRGSNVDVDGCSVGVNYNTKESTYH